MTESLPKAAVDNRSEQLDHTNSKFYRARAHSEPEAVAMAKTEAQAAEAAAAATKLAKKNTEKPK